MSTPPPFHARVVGYDRRADDLVFYAIEIVDQVDADPYYVFRTYLNFSTFYQQLTLAVPELVSGYNPPPESALWRSVYSFFVKSADCPSPEEISVCIESFQYLLDLVLQPSTSNPLPWTIPVAKKFFQYSKQDSDLALYFYRNKLRYLRNRKNRTDEEQMQVQNAMDWVKRLNRAALSVRRKREQRRLEAEERKEAREAEEEERARQQAESQRGGTETDELAFVIQGDEFEEPGELFDVEL